MAVSILPNENKGFVYKENDRKNFDIRISLPDTVKQPG